MNMDLNLEVGFVGSDVLDNLLTIKFNNKFLKIEENDLELLLEILNKKNNLEVKFHNGKKG